MPLRSGQRAELLPGLELRGPSSPQTGRGLALQGPGSHFLSLLLVLISPTGPLPALAEFPFLLPRPSGSSITSMLGLSQALCGVPHLEALFPLPCPKRPRQCLVFVSRALIRVHLCVLCPGPLSCLISMSHICMCPCSQGSWEVKAMGRPWRGGGSGSPQHRRSCYITVGHQSSPGH